MACASRKRTPALPRRRLLSDTRIRCYASGAAIGGRNFNRIPRRTALELVSEHAATWILGGKAIRMFAREELRMRQSFILTVAFMHGVATGDSYCLRLWACVRPCLLIAPRPDSGVGNIPYYAYDTEYVEGDVIAVDEKMRSHRA